MPLELKVVYDRIPNIRPPSAEIIRPNTKNYMETGEKR